MDVTGKRVLIFGDSLTHRGSRSSPDARVVTEGVDRNSSPGDLLASQLLAAGAEAARINGRVSRSAYHFIATEEAGAILDEESDWQPDYVFVFLGTNDLGLSAAKDQAAFTMIHDAFVDRGAEVWAIGPPSFAAKTATTEAKVVYKTLKTVFGANRVIDLRPLTADMTVSGRTDDGVHFTSSGAKVVAAKLAGTIAELPEPKALAWAQPPVMLGVAAGVVAGILLTRHALKR